MLGFSKHNAKAHEKVTGEKKQSMSLCRTTGTKAVSVALRQPKPSYPQHLCSDLNTSHFCKLERAAFTSVMLTTLANEKEEERGAKEQAQKQKFQEDKPASKTQEVNVTEK